MTDSIQLNDVIDEDAAQIPVYVPPPDGAVLTPRQARMFQHTPIPVDEWNQLMADELQTLADAKSAELDTLTARLATAQARISVAGKTQVTA